MRKILTIAIIGALLDVGSSMMSTSQDTFMFRLAKTRAPIQYEKTTLSIEESFRNPKIQLTKNKRHFSIEYSKDDQEFFLLGNNGKLLSCTEKEIRTHNLVYRVDEPRIRYHYSSHGFKMWKLLQVNFFDNFPTELIYRCQGTVIVGGRCHTSDRDLSDVYHLPAHEKLRIVANYHFIGTWEGHMSYLKYLKGSKFEYLWTDSLDSRSGPHGEGSLAACPKSKKDSKYSQIIDVSFEHKEKSIRLNFGSTLEDNPCDASYGISNVQIYYK